MRRAAGGRPLFTAALEDRALLLLREGRVAPAVEGLSVLTELGPNHPQWHPRRPLKLLLAARLLQDGQAYAAKELLQTLTVSEEQHRGAARLATLAALSLQEDAEAARLAEEWLAADPDSARASLIAGNTRAEQGDPTGAVTAWKNAALKDSDLRDEALRSWSEAALTEQEPDELLAFLDELAAAEPRLSNFAREIQAYAIALDGRPAAAHRLYSALAADEPDEPRHRLNRCSTGLAAGVATAHSGTCTALRGSQLEEAMIEAAQLSRQAGVLPGYPRDTSGPARAALAIAPRDRDVARTALHSLAPTSPPAIQEELLARWRVAMGAEVAAPVEALKASGPDR